MNNAESLEVCRTTRRIASDSLLTVLKILLKSNDPLSEIKLRDVWLEELRKNKSIFPDGWYTPPPHGITVLFATDTNCERVNFESLRPEAQWPRADSFLNKEHGIAYLYACPVDKKTGIIGDFQVTLYFGKNPEIKELLKTCLFIDKQVYDFANTGMKLADIASFSDKLLLENGMKNQIVSITDGAVVNIGHTIPVPYVEWNDGERTAYAKGEKNWQQIKDIISKKRIFTNTAQDYIIRAGDAITIEPRPKVTDKPYLPNSLGYHVIALFKENSEKELLTDFRELFILAGMDYMSDI